jgi:hypothetical protein
MGLNNVMMVMTQKNSKFYLVAPHTKALFVCHYDLESGSLVHIGMVGFQQTKFILLHNKKNQHWC